MKYLWIPVNLIFVGLVAAGTVSGVDGAANLGIVLSWLFLVGALSHLSGEVRASYAKFPQWRRHGAAVCKLVVACLWAWYGHGVMTAVVVIGSLIILGGYQYSVREGEV